ncbi:MAG TPA: SDR family oxidoreductase [Candidatus Limnocylindrales bacterium]|nr:SDR family oxidoreductase [Candidatus Limnocylindrales bacterium]
MATRLIDPPPLPRQVFASDLLAGKTALVTGGGSGLGRAIADQLSAAGADLLIAARNVERLEHAASEIRSATGRRVETGMVDIRSREAVEALAERAHSLYPRIDILVNNAGGQFAQPARDFRPKGWNAVIETNLTGTWNMTQVFGVAMLEGQGGAIVNVIAVVGRGFPGIAHTGAARAGVLELSRTLAYEWGPKVRVNCVAPGAIRTAAFETTYHPDIDKMCEGIPIPRFGRPEEAAYAVTYLASPAASWITGEVIYVAGGAQSYGLNQALFDEAFGRGSHS